MSQEGKAEHSQHQELLVNLKKVEDFPLERVTEFLQGWQYAPSYDTESNLTGYEFSRDLGFEKHNIFIHLNGKSKSVLFFIDFPKHPARVPLEASIGMKLFDLKSVRFDYLNKRLTFEGKKGRYSIQQDGAHRFESNDRAISSIYSVGRVDN